MSCKGMVGDEWVANGKRGNVGNRRDGDISVKNLAEKEIWRSDFLRRKEIGRIGGVGLSVRTTNLFREVCRIEVMR